MLSNILSHFWWMTLLRGLLWIAFGVSIFVMPGISVLTLTLFIGAVILADGIINAANAIGGRKEGENWWILLLVGLAGITVGILALLNPAATSLALIFYIAIWATAIGVLQIVGAIRLRKEIEGEVWMALGGLASIAFGVLLIVNPASGALAILWLIGAYAIAWGVLLLLLAFRVRRVEKKFTSAARI